MATQTVQSMISEVSICNRALSWVGKSAIANFNDPSKAANWCRTNYAFIRDAVLEERMWTFARVRAVSQSATKGEWGDEYRHQRPIEWLKVFKVFDSASADIFQDTQVQWTMEDEHVLTCQQTVYLWGVRRVTDTGKFTNLFTEALVARLASNMAIPIAGSTKQQALYLNLYDKLLADAAVRDGQQGSNTRIKSGTLIDARRRVG